MKLSKIIVAFVLAMLLSGCMNLAIRLPFNDSEIKDTYQSTEAMVGVSYIVMFPQVIMSSGDTSFCAENIISIPISCVFWADTLVEFAVDTVCWPYDYFQKRPTEYSR